MLPPEHNTMKKEILIKGMVCDRCIAVLRRRLACEGYCVEEVSLGKVVLRTFLDKQQQGFQVLLQELGFEPVVDKQARLVSQVKVIIQATIDQVVQGREAKFKLSQVLADRLGVNYSSLSTMFSRLEGITIEQYVIQRRLVLVKELLEQSDKSFTDIACLTGFSSVFHFSRQFKDLTGLTPSRYRETIRTGSWERLPVRKRHQKRKRDGHIVPML